MWFSDIRSHNACNTDQMLVEKANFLPKIWPSIENLLVLQDGYINSRNATTSVGVLPTRKPIMQLSLLDDALDFKKITVARSLWK